MGQQRIRHDWAHTHGNDVKTKSKSDRFSYSSSKWVVKQWRQLTSSTVHLAQELLTNVQGSGGWRHFAKKTRTLKMRSTVTSHWKLTVTNERIIDTDPLIVTQKLLTFQWSFGIWNKLERWKARWVVTSWTDYKSKNVIILKCLLTSLILHNNKPSLHI